MRLLLFLLVATTVARAVCTRERIISCMLQYIDSNNDTQISVSEWNQFILYTTCGEYVPKVSGTTIMNNCDKNGDSLLDATDYDDFNSCMIVDALRESICLTCDQCDAHPA